MIEALQYEFMQNALLAGILISIAAGIIGSLVIVNRITFLAGGIAHSSYGGIGIAIYMGIPVLFGATVFSIITAVIIAILTLNDKKRIDSIIGIMWATGMAIGIVFVDMTPGYNVDLIDDSEGNYKLKLLHNDVKDEITDVKEHLSFGERNAFSLVLFMYDVLKHSPDLVILDDPISSFDKNKKYAIVDMLFRKEKSLKGKTVLLLTHDFEPIIDMIHHHRNRFEIPTASFLENNHGVLVEKEIQRADVQTFIEINESNIKILSDQIINKLVYLRRLYEIKNAKGNGYQLISNLIHKREKPEFKDESGIRDMTPNEIDSGNSEIQELIDDFDYSKVLDIINDDKEMKRIYSETKNSYEKLHIYRIIFDNKDKTDSSVIKKFIDEAFHIENDYIYQLNPRKYQMVPQFVIDECDKAISNI